MANDTAYVFEGDDEELVEPLPQWGVPGGPMALRRYLARRLVDEFEKDGSYLSPTGGTLWVILAYARHKEIPIVVHENDRFGGWLVEKVH